MCGLCTGSEKSVKCKLKKASQDTCSARQRILHASKDVSQSQRLSRKSSQDSPREWFFLAKEIRNLYTIDITFGNLGGKIREKARTWNRRRGVCR